MDLSIVMDFFLLICSTVSELSEGYFSNLPSNTTNSSETAVYSIGVIADQDEKSRHPDHADQSTSFFLPGNLTLTYNREKGQENPSVDIRWNFKERHTILLTGTSIKKGQATAEFSELIKFNDNLLTCDDKTGILYSLHKVPDLLNLQPYKWELRPFLSLDEGDERPFKCEWMTLKDGKLWIGSQAYKVKRPELTSVKIVSADGHVETRPWAGNYQRIKSALNVPDYGYVTHEAGAWSDSLQKWIFIPRKVSRQPFDKKGDENNGGHVIVFADENFENVTTVEIGGDFDPTHGVTSFKIIPLKNSASGAKESNYIVALKASETVDSAGVKSLQTFVLAFDLNGRILYPETLIEDVKYEGIEFLRKK